MRLFNAFQLVAAFVAWPFLVAWLANADFRGAQVATFGAGAAYVVAFGCMVATVYEAMKTE